MRTALDTSVLLDILGNDPVHAGPSEAALRKAARDGALVVCETVVAELGPVLGPEGVLAFLEDARILFVPTSLEAANLAGAMYAVYLRRRKAPARVIPDFLVGAHAMIHTDRLLARDRGYYRDYFKGLRLWMPSDPL